MYSTFSAGTHQLKPQYNEQGIEKTLMTNFVGPFLLTHLLLPRIITSGTPEAHARIVHVSSEAHQLLPDGKKKNCIDWADLNARLVVF
jgi:NAD(P)-dependent dehydrogenase (short-subunit alcohol dehydrogenase family)